MSYVVSLIERTKDFLPKKTDYALCQAIGVSYSDLRKLRAGKGFFGPKQRVRIHEITRIPLEEITAMLEHDRAKKDDDKDFWEKRLPRISAASVIALSLYAAANGHHGEITALFLTAFPADRFIHYANCEIIGTVIALAVFWKISRTAPQYISVATLGHVTRQTS